MRRLLVLTLVLFSSAFGAGTAYACSCVREPTLREAVARSEVAFVGEVTSRRGGGVYDVRVDGVLKGRVGPSVRLGVLDMRRTSCGTTLDLGPIVYAGGRDLEVNLCTPRWTGAEAATALAASRLKPAPPSVDAQVLPDTGREPSALRRSLPWVVLGAVAAAGAGAGAVAVARRRRVLPS